MNLMENRNKGYLTAGLALGGLMLTGYLAVFIVPSALVTFSKAAPIAKASLSNSYLLGDKMLAKADGVDACKVNVFVVDAVGKGVPSKTVMLDGVTGVKPMASSTDANGKMTFEVTSKVEGQFPLTARVDGMALPKQVTVTFRNTD